MTLWSVLIYVFNTRLLPPFGSPDFDRWQNLIKFCQLNLWPSFIIISLITSSTIITSSKNQNLLAELSLLLLFTLCFHTSVYICQFWHENVSALNHMVGLQKYAPHPLADSHGPDEKIFCNMLRVDWFPAILCLPFIWKRHCSCKDPSSIAVIK
jgi:hypothetical protein